MGETTVRIPRDAHAGLLAAIIPGHSFLVSRGNEDDLVKNPGFIRGVVSIANEGPDAVMTTVALEPVDIIRGHFDFGGLERPRFILPGARAKQNAPGAPSTQSRGDDLNAAATVTLLDVQRTIDFPEIALGAAKFPIATKSGEKEFNIEASMMASMDTNMFLEVGVNGGIDLGPPTWPTFTSKRPCATKSVHKPPFASMRPRSGSSPQASRRGEASTELKVGVGVDAGPFHPYTSATLYSGYEAFQSFGEASCGGAKAK